MLRFQRNKVEQSKMRSPLKSTVKDGTGASVLDPHNSIMELLQATEVETGATIQEEPSLSESLGESWQPVASMEVEENNNQITRQITNQTNNSSSILSSSDTSEEEEIVELQQPDSYKNFHMTTDEGYVMNPKVCSNGAGNRGDEVVICGGTKDDSISRSATENRAEKYNATGVFEESELSATGSLARSTGSSSTSFVMPKLSLTYKTSQLKTLLVIGRPGRVFYETIPDTYKEYFELPVGISAHDFSNHLGIVIVFQELKELVSLLNRIIQYSDKIPIIPVCESEQRLKVKNILETFLKNQMIVLMYPPVSIANKKEINKMLQYTKKLVKKLKNKEISGCEEIAFASGSSSGCNSLDTSEKFKKNPKKKRKSRKVPNNYYGKWLTWGISLTIGVSIGYCATYIITTTLFYGIPKDTSQIKSAAAGHKGFPAITSGSSNNPSIGHSKDYCGDSQHHGFFKHTISIIKKTFHKINGTMGTMITSITHIIKQNTIPDDQVLALGYMLS